MGWKTWPIHRYKWAQGVVPSDFKAAFKTFKFTTKLSLLDTWHFSAAILAKSWSEILLSAPIPTPTPMEIGQSDISETAAGTDPNDATSLFTLSDPVRSANGVTLSWPSVSGTD